jgi:hypothetical protein
MEPSLPLWAHRETVLRSTKRRAAIPLGVSNSSPAGCIAMATFLNDQDGNPVTTDGLPAWETPRSPKPAPPLEGRSVTGLLTRTVHSQRQRRPVWGSSVPTWPCGSSSSARIGCCPEPRCLGRARDLGFGATRPRCVTELRQRTLTASSHLVCRPPPVSVRGVAVGHPMTGGRPANKIAKPCGIVG